VTPRESQLFTHECLQPLAGLTTVSVALRSVLLLHAIEVLGDLR